MAHTSYLNKLTPGLFHETVLKVCNAIVEHFPDCNLVASRGLSGTMIVPAVAAFLGIEWGIVRKDGGKNHSGFVAEVSHFPDEPKAVFVDDLISTGTTFRETEKGIADHAGDYNKSVKWLGGVLYDQSYPENVRLSDGEKVTCYGATEE